MIPIILEPFTSEIVKSNRNAVYFPYWSKRNYAFEIGQQYFLQERFTFDAKRNIIYEIDSPNACTVPTKGWVNAGFLKDYRSRVKLECISSEKKRFGDLTVTEYMNGINYEMDDIVIVFKFKRI